MDLIKILTIVTSIISILITSGTLVALFQLRATNNKLMAEAELKKAEAEAKRAEAKKIENDSNVAVFQAQINAATQLSTSFISRLDTLTKRLSTYEIDAMDREKRISLLEKESENFKEENQKQKHTIFSLCSLIRKLIITVNTHLETIKISDLPSTITILDMKLKEDFDSFTREFKDILEDVEEEKK
jgi:chromosome segregation ATPase